MRSLLVLGASAVLLAASPVPIDEPPPCAPGPIYQAAAAPVTATLPASASGPLTLASLNIAGESRIAEAVEAWTRHRAVDVLFLQEVGGDDEDGASFAAALGQRLGFGSAYAPARPYGDTGHQQGLAIVSRYPLDDVSVRMLPYNRLRFRSRCRIAVAATLRTPAGPVRLVNVHLDTRINRARRLVQVDAAVAALNGFEGPRVVGGDFNTADFAWIGSTWPVPFVQKQAKAVQERMSSVGFATPFGDTRGTYPLLGLGGVAFKLDWLFLSPDLDANGSGVDDVPITDHRGIWTRAVAGSNSATSRRSDPTAFRR
jgi:endonuclease/exonuclease/phosphatase family metal-dependent hydrolase